MSESPIQDFGRVNDDSNRTSSEVAGLELRYPPSAVALDVDAQGNAIIGINLDEKLRDEERAGFRNSKRQVGEEIFSLMGWLDQDGLFKAVQVHIFG